jgi:tRNA1(Val) A37 N6-methylase TrmN6
VETTEDRLLGGRVVFRQPARGYRAAIDSVLVAAIVPAFREERVLEAGLGAGAAALCLLARMPGVRVTGVEIDPALADLAAGNAAANGWAERLAVVTADIIGFAAGQFDHAMANPPFRAHGSGSIPPEPRHASADAEAASGALGAWVAAMTRRVVPRGTVSLVLPAGRLADTVVAFRVAGLGALALRPVAPHEGAPAKRILLQGRKGARGEDSLSPPLVVHAREGGYSRAMRMVLEDGARLVP